MHNNWKRKRKFHIYTLKLLLQCDLAELHRSDGAFQCDLTSLYVCVYADSFAAVAFVLLHCRLSLQWQKEFLKVREKEREREREREREGEGEDGQKNRLEKSHTKRQKIDKGNCKQ